MKIKAPVRTLCLSLLAVLVASSAWPVANEFKLGIGENVRRQDPPGSGPYLNLTTSLANRGVNQDFITHWFHAGWKTHFPNSGVSYLAGYCNSGGEYNDLASYQAVLNAGKRLVLVWWWHNDNPCDLALRTDAENALRDCLVPMIKALTPGPGLGSQVYVVLQPESNQYGPCNAYKDPTWSTHLNTLLAQVHSVSVPGLTVQAGPGVGDWAYDVSAYQVEGSLSGAIANSDFVAFHNIFRQNSDHPTPNDTNYGNPSPDQIEHAASYARYLKKRFNKPVLYAYQSTNTTNYGNTAQSDALLDIFRRRATLEAADVKLFGPFWLFPDAGYPGESLIDSGNTQRPAFTTWKNESNAVIANTDRTHSIGFVAPDQGDELAGTVSVQWISRGRPQTASTFNLDVSVNGGAFSSVATGLAGSDTGIMSYAWDACSIAPAADVRLRLTCPATGATVTSGRFAVKKLSATSNAQHTFEAGTHNWVPASGGNCTVSRVGGETFFHGASSGSLKVVATFSAGANAYIENTSPGITIAGTPRFTALIYVPFDLNPCIIPGAEVSKVKIDMQSSSYMTTPQILLQQGWNRVVYDFTGASGAVTYLKMNFNNKWGFTGNPAIYVDEIRIGGDLLFTGGACSSPTHTPTLTVVSGTSTFTPTPASGSPTSTRTPSATFTPTPTTAAVCAPEYNFDSGSTQGMAGSTAAVTSVSATGTMPYQGAGSLQVGLALTSTNNQGLISTTTGFPKDYSGKILSYWLYVPAGMSNASNPSGATLFVKTGAAFTWAESTWVNLPSTAGWVQLSLDMAGVANPNDVKELGVKIALGGASPNWTGTVYVDSLGAPATCPSPTFTVTTAAANTATRTITPSITPSSTRTVTLTVTPLSSATSTRTPTFSSTVTSTWSASPTFSSTATGTLTRTLTVTPSVTPTFSSTVTLSSTGTPTSTRTSTVVQSPTSTSTVTSFAGSPTNTPSATPTNSPSPVQSATSTITTTRTITPSNTPSFSSTVTPSSSVTPSVTRTNTVVQSPTFTYTETPFAGSPTDTPTETPSSTETLVLSSTPTETLQDTATSTPTPQDTATLTVTMTAAGSATFTETVAVPSATPTRTITATPSNSSTALPATFTATRTQTPLPSATLTFTPQGSVTPAKIGSVISVLPSINPQPGGTLLLSVRLSGVVDSLEIKLYSTGYNRVVTLHVDGPWGAGWQSLALPIPGDLPNGTYFVLVMGRQANGQPTGLGRRAKLVILK